MLIDPLREAAQKGGYALAVHGSLARDIDLIAVPWLPAAVSAEQLVAEIIAVVRAKNDGVAIVLTNGDDPNDETTRNPSRKPHGRLSWSIHLGGGPYIDLSVTPRLENPPTSD